MADGIVNVKPEDLRRLAKATERLEATVKEAAKEFDRELARAYWHDHQKDKFVGEFASFRKSLDSFMGNKLKPMRDYLTKLAYRLEHL